MKRGLHVTPKVSKNRKISDFFKKVERNEESDKTTFTSRASESQSKRRCIEKPTSSKIKNDNIEDFVDISQFVTCEIKEESPSDVQIVHEIVDDTSPILKEITASKTPTKNTPKKKLFSKSPKHLYEFNVQVIESFIEITPSKRGCSDEKRSKSKSPASGKKLQSSLYAYISPSAKSSVAKNLNETTPVKTPMAKNGIVTPQNEKIKVKLNFGSPKNTKTFEEDKENSLEHSNFDCFQEDSWDGVNWAGKTLENNLDLTQSQHCKVLEVERAINKCTLILESTVTQEKASCILEGFWYHCTINPGDRIHVNAVKNSSSQWVVNNENGLLVFEPDYLVSGTAVVGSLFCKRRSVLSEQYCETGQDNRAMVVGVLVHHLLQVALERKAKNEHQLKDIMQTLLTSRDTIKLLYSSSLTLLEVETELRNFIPRVLEFIDQYIYRKIPTSKNNWQGKIDAIEDIEENFWCPDLGIKGKVDVSVKVKDSIIPLELKTGKASVSLEHRAQVMMYALMMSKFGYKVNSGLLLYLREGVLKEIPLTQKEKRDIIMLRNDLVYFLSKGSYLKLENTNCEKSESLSDLLLSKKVNIYLPEPINHRSCKTCPYNTICTAYAKLENLDLSGNQTLQTVQEQIQTKVHKSHLSYFFEWSLLLSMENETCKNDKKEVREIFTVDPETRESKGKCLAFMKISNIESNNDMFLITLIKRQSSTSDNFLKSQIGENNYIVISTQKRPAVAFGFVADIQCNSIVLTVDRDLTVKYPTETFHLDLYDSNNSHLFNMTNLALVLEQTKQAKRIRKFVIDRKVPTFQEKLPKSTINKAASILQRLNRAQQKAVLKALCANDYVLIKGMPGTGKTATIVALIQVLLNFDKTVLVTSHTHTAVDNVCIRLLKYNIKPLRLGSSSRIHQNLVNFSESVLTKDCSTPEELELIYNSAKVVAVTCLGSGHPLLVKRKFDVCIIDESTQVLQPTVFRPLLCAEKFVLIGDPDQLPPVVRNTLALERGMSESIFERLQSSETTVALNLNYRMNDTITALANHLTYDGELMVANEKVGKSHLQLPKLSEILNPLDYWLKEALDPSLKSAVKFIDTGQSWLYKTNSTFHASSDVSEKSCSNYCETVIVTILSKLLMKAGLSNVSLGIIAPYRAQVFEIKNALQGAEIEISTVDQFQGRDKDVIIFSCTKSLDVSQIETPRKFEILEDTRRLNVAITRAKLKLIIIGDLVTVKSYGPFKKMLQNFGENIVTACKDEKSFEKIVNFSKRL